jgi:hypothetical protein
MQRTKATHQESLHEKTGTETHMLSKALELP